MACAGRTRPPLHPRLVEAQGIGNTSDRRSRYRRQLRHHPRVRSLPLFRCLVLHAGRSTPPALLRCGGRCVGCNRRRWRCWCHHLAPFRVSQRQPLLARMHEGSLVTTSTCRAAPDDTRLVAGVLLEELRPVGILCNASPCSLALNERPTSHVEHTHSKTARLCGFSKHGETLAGSYLHLLEDPREESGGRLYLEDVPVVWPPGVPCHHERTVADRLVDKRWVHAKLGEDVGGDSTSKGLHSSPSSVRYRRQRNVECLLQHSRLNLSRRRRE